jgi:predicted nucleotidyltransferase
MTALELIEKHRDEILRLAEYHGYRNVRVFGSVVRGEDRPDSDIDLLVDPTPEASLFDHIALMQDLEELLGRKVDVVSAGAVHWFIRDRVFADAKPL